MFLQSEDQPPTVIVVDDDKSVRDALFGLFRSVELAVEAFESVQAYLDRGNPDAPGCIVLDVRLRGKSGLDFQDDLIRASNHRPIIFISGHADVAMSVRAMKAGAVDFLTKPVREQDLLDAVQLAIERDRRRRTEERDLAQLRGRYGTLTLREQEILKQVVLGRRNKQIAHDVGLTEATVKLHRGQIMRKLSATSVVELLRMTDALSAQEGGRLDQSRASLALSPSGRLPKTN